MAEYKYAEKAWKKFRIRNFGDYHGLYVESDTVIS